MEGGARTPQGVIIADAATIRGLAWRDER